MITRSFLLAALVPLVGGVVFAAVYSGNRTVDHVAAQQEERLHDSLDRIERTADPLPPWLLGHWVHEVERAVHMYGRNRIQDLRSADEARRRISKQAVREILAASALIPLEAQVDVAVTGWSFLDDHLRGELSGTFGEAIQVKLDALRNEGLSGYEARSLSAAVRRVRSGPPGLLPDTFDLPDDEQLRAGTNQAIAASAVAHLSSLGILQDYRLRGDTLELHLSQDAPGYSPERARSLIFGVAEAVHPLVVITPMTE